MNAHARRPPRALPWGWRAVLALVSAALAGLAVARWPALAQESLRGTLAMLPVVATGLWVLAAAARRQGARRLAPEASWAEALALAVLVLLALGRSRLGLELSAPLLMVGFCLLLAHRVARQLIALRPLLGRSVPRRPSLAFFFLPLLAYLAILPWSTSQRDLDGDEPFYLLITHSLIHDFDADLSNDYAEQHSLSFMGRPLEPQFGDPLGPHGEKYSRHNWLLPLVLAPAYAVAGRFGALVTMAALTALLAWMTLRIAHRYLPERPGGALLAYGLLSFAPPLLLYSHQIWVEVPAALLALLALDQILDCPRERAWGPRHWLRIALPLMLLPLVKIRLMLLSMSLLALAWFYAPRPRRSLLILGGLLGFLGVGILAFNQVRYGNPLKIHTMEELAIYDRGVQRYLEGSLGMFFDTAFGLIPSAPLWLLLLPAVVALAWRRQPLARDAAVFALPYLIIVMPRMEWYGGWSPPFRYGLFCLPLLALFLAGVFERRRQAGLRLLLVFLGLLTLLATLLWLAVPGWTYNFADGRTYVLDHASRLLGSDVARLFPSYVRPRAATWLWPPVALAAVMAFWFWRGGSRARRVAARAGVLLIPAGLALVPLAAAHLPSRVIELEDAQVMRKGGHIYPDRWIVERTRYRGGWILRPREYLKAPVVAGGRRVRLALDAYYVRNSNWPLSLEVRAGERLLKVWHPEVPRRWQRLELGTFNWPAGEPLVLEVRSPPSRQKRLMNGVLVDRVVLEWVP